VQPRQGRGCGPLNVSQTLAPRQTRVLLDTTAPVPSAASDCYRMTGPIVSNTAQHQQRTARLILLSESSSGKPDGTSFPHDLLQWECNGVCSALASQVVRAPSARLGMNVNMIDAPQLHIPRRRTPLGRVHGQPQAHGLYQLPLCMQ
jgi:hypothetical protein